MGSVYIFRGKSATGKSTFSDMLARKLSIPVIRIDDIIDALKTTQDIDKSLINNTVCFNIICKIIQTNLDLGADFIIDVGLGDKKMAEWFLNRLNFGNNKAICFLVVCSDESEWRKRHMKRIANPLPNQSFKSFEHVLEHYKNFDATPFEYEHIIDSALSIEKCFDEMISIINL